MSTTRILSIVFFLVAVGLAYYLISSVKFDIDEEKRIAEGEAKIIERLRLIREAEIVYQEVNGNYTSDWDKLISFIDTGRYFLTERSEEIITLDYGADSVVVNIDTIGVIPAKQRIFEEVVYVLAGDDGSFGEYMVDVGDKISVNQKIYTYRKTGDDRFLSYRATVTGTIQEIEPKSRGDNVGKGEQLMEVLNFKFDPNMDISRIPFVPGDKEQTKFLIYADEIERSGVMIDVIEVVNPKPVDPTRKESNEIRNRKPLRFGSRTDVTTGGNWE
jgi:hypothetical protein